MGLCCCKPSIDDLEEATGLLYGRQQHDAANRSGTNASATAESQVDDDDDYEYERERKKRHISRRTMPNFFLCIRLDVDTVVSNATTMQKMDYIGEWSKWRTDPHSIHVTLCVLYLEDADDIRDCIVSIKDYVTDWFVKTASEPRLVMRVRGVGVFHPRVLYAGVTGYPSGMLENFQKGLSSHLQSEEFAISGHSNFVPHATLFKIRWIQMKHGKAKGRRHAKREYDTHDDDGAMPRIDNSIRDHDDIANEGISTDTRTASWRNNLHFTFEQIRARFQEFDFGSVGRHDDGTDVILSLCEMQQRKPGMFYRTHYEVSLKTMIERDIAVISASKRGGSGTLGTTGSWSGTSANSRTPGSVSGSHATPSSYSMRRTPTPLSHLAHPLTPPPTTATVLVHEASPAL